MNKQFERKHMSIVGKITLRIIRFSYQCLYRIQSTSLLSTKESNEDPATMGILGAFSLGLKYYDSSYFDTFDTVPLCQRLKVNNLVTGDCVVHIAGDLMPYKNLSNKNRVSHMWDHVGDQFFNADIVCANLETPINITKDPRYAPEVMVSDIYFNADEEIFKLFCGSSDQKKYDVLSLANNHMLDQGINGLEHTKEFLSKQNICTTGFVSDNGTQTTSLISSQGVKVGFASRTYSLNKEKVPKYFAGKINILDLNDICCDYTKIYNEMIELKVQGADYIVLSLHMGHAYQGSPSGSTIENIKSIFDKCGPDMIVITHPHTLQPMGSYNFTDPLSGKKKVGVVYYSLGNFIADDIYVPTRLSGYVKLGISKDNKGKLGISHKLVLTYMYKTQNEQLVMLPISDMNTIDDPIAQERIESDEYPIVRDICRLLCDYD